MYRYLLTCQAASDLARGGGSASLLPPFRSRMYKDSKQDSFDIELSSIKSHVTGHDGTTAPGDAGADSETHPLRPVESQNGICKCLALSGLNIAFFVHHD